MSTAGRPAGRDLAMRDVRPAAGASNRPTSQTQLQVTGWKSPNYKFSSEEDSGVSHLTKFIERKGTMQLTKLNTTSGIKKSSPVRIRKVRLQSRG
jgi:hypothetical protein